MPRLSLEGVPVLCGPGAGPSRRWLAETTTIEQAGTDATGFRLDTHEVVTGAIATVDGQGANVLAAGGGVWAARLATPPGGRPEDYGYRDSLGRRHPEWEPLEVDVDGAVVVLAHYQDGRGLILVRADGTMTPMTDVVVDRHEADISRGTVIYLSGGQLHRWPQGDTFPVPLLEARYADGYVTGDGPQGLTFALWAQPTRGLVLSTDDHDFNPDISVLASGLVRVVSSKTAGEGPGDLRSYDINPSSGAVNGVIQPWVDLTAPSIRVPMFAATTRRIGLGLFDEPRPAPQIMFVGESLNADTRAQWDQVPFTPPGRTEFPLMALKDGPSYAPAECPSGCLPFIEAYPIPYQEDASQCMERIAATVRGFPGPVVLCVCTFLGWNGVTYVRDEQIVIDTLWYLWELTLREPKIVAWWGFTYTRGAGIDGLVHWPNLQETWKRLRAASADWQHFPTFAPVPPKPPTPKPPTPPVEDTTMTTCAIRPIVSQTYLVAEMAEPVPSVNARATSPEGPWQTFDIIGMDKGANALVRCHGTTKYLSINPSGDPVAYTDVPHVWKVTRNGAQFGLYAEGFGWLVIEQGSADAPTYRATVRARGEPMSSWTTFEATDATGKVIPNPF